MRHSQAAIRARVALPPQAPPVTVYPSDTPCNGLAFVRLHGDDLPDLSSLRDQVIGLRRGTIGVEDNSRELLVVLFDSLVKAPGFGHPSALPLVMDGSGVLVSYGQPRVDPASRTSGSVRAVDIWWAGKGQRISLDLLETVAVSVLWTMPNATVHAGLMPPVSERNNGARDPAHADQTTPLPAEVARSVGLAALESERGADPFAGARDSLGRKPTLSASLRIAMASLPKPGDLVRYALYGLFALFLISTLVRGGSILPFVILFATVRFIGGLVFGSSGTSGRNVPPRPRGPGFLDNLLGWLAWKNPFGSMQRQLDARVRQVKALAARGMIDDALRLALRLSSNGGRRKLPRRYPRQLPSARARLDFDYAEAKFEMPVLSEQISWEMRQTYEELAKRLEGEEDFSRAAFVRSQLLGQHEQAVHLLERGGMMDEAVRLALAAKVDPTLAIRLLYDTGRQDAALALASRSGCFDRLVEQSRGKDAAFHVLIIKAWTDALIESGQPLRALQVTDTLASEPGADRVLQGLRRKWLGSAMQAVEAGGFAPEPLARSLLCGQFGDPGQLADFPRSLPRSGDPLLGEALAALRAIIRDGKDGEELLALLGTLHRLSAPSAEEQADFWNGTGPALIEVLSGALLRQASHRLDHRDMDMLGQLLERVGHRVLAHDLGKLRKLYSAGPPLKRDWHLPGPETMASPVLAACVLGNGSILAWRESELLELLDASGAVVWRQAVSAVSALVPVGSGANTLILQGEAGGLTRITRFDSVRRSLHPVGAVELLAHHDVTSELAWLVQIGGEIGALDLAALCAAAPRLEFLWSCALTERLRAVAFLQEETSASWITIDVTPDRLGLTEQWRLEGSGKLTTSIYRVYAQGNTSDPVPPVLWAWSANNGHSFCQSLNLKDVHLSSSTWSEENESLAREQVRKRKELGGFDGFLPCDFGRSAVILAAPDTTHETVLSTIVRVLDEKLPDFSLHHDATTALAVLARLPAGLAARPLSGKKEPRQPGGKVLLADRCGRMFLVDPQSARVTLL